MLLGGENIVQGNEVEGKGISTNGKGKEALLDTQKVPRYLLAPHSMLILAGRDH
jgi:hypothetical protein